jgi:hypothetical protein
MARVVCVYLAVVGKVVRLDVDVEEVLAEIESPGVVGLTIFARGLVNVFTVVTVVRTKGLHIKAPVKAVVVPDVVNVVVTELVLRYLSVESV